MANKKVKLSKKLGGLVVLWFLAGLLATKPCFAQNGSGALFGFNIHHLAKMEEQDISSILQKLSTDCSTKIVRIWGYETGIDAYVSLEKVLRNAPEDVKFIVALEDFAPIIEDPVNWYQEAARPGSNYYRHVQRMLERYGKNPQILVWELANEPSCGGYYDACLPNFLNWVEKISNLIDGYTDAYISPGLIGIPQFSEYDYERISNTGSINANSCHFYSSYSDNVVSCQWAFDHKGRVEFIYAGEAGYEGEFDCSGGGCTTKHCENCCERPILEKRAKKALADYETLSKMGFDAFLIWQFSPLGRACDNFSVFPGDPLCPGILNIAPDELTLPPNRKTEWADSVPGRNIPCRPLVVSQQQWASDTTKGANYFNPYFFNTDPLAADSLSGFPFDYSPWRPFPGDAGRAFYDTKGNIINQPHNEDDQDVCYDLEKLEKEKQITSYCNPSPQITDYIQWFPDESALEKTVRVLGYYRPFWTDSPAPEYKTTQIPFLGNSLTASREYTDNAQRMSLFVNDFLRGTVYWDQTEVEERDPRIAPESGPIRKLLPKNRQINNEYIDAYIGCRLFKDPDQCGYPLLHEDAIHDYAVLWTTGDAGIIKTGNFTDLPDHREIKKSSAVPNPWRLSAWFCGLPGIARPLKYTNLCPEDDYSGEGIYWIRSQEGYPYFPLTSREDVPAVVDVGFDGVWDPNDPRLSEIPPGKPFPVGYQMKMEDYYAVIEDGYWEDSNGDGIMEYNKWGGIYHIDKGANSPDSDPPLPMYEFHFVDLVFIPHIAEARELGEWAGLTLTPYTMMKKDLPDFWEKDRSVHQLNLVTSRTCEINDIARGGPGDALAVDWRHSFRYVDYPTDPWNIGNEGERQLRILREEKAIPDPLHDWWCKADPSEWPDRETTPIESNKGWVVTKIPYLEQVAKRLIGQAGVFKTLMPYSFNEEVEDLITEVGRGSVYPWELPGYGPAQHSYNNGLAPEGVKEHWGCCNYPGDKCDGMDYPQADCPDYCKWNSEAGLCIVPGTKVDCIAPCNCDYCSKDNCGPVSKDGSDIRGWGTANNEDARFYYPYIGTIDIFRQYFMNAVLPSELSTL
ncbi:MAG TPA: beta-galactosidase [Candidatus Bathyarchaeia archaeon]|nr:beta-galactosidase [Candidatus Bathyarchaeia archaeon]